MATITRTTTTSVTDPLGYDGPLPERLRAMAEDAVAGRNQDAVEAEATVLRARLGLPRQAVAIEDLPADMVKALHEAVAAEPEADGLDHLLLEGGEWSPAAERLLEGEVSRGDTLDRIGQALLTAEYTDITRLNQLLDEIEQRQPPRPSLKEAMLVTFPTTDSDRTVTLETLRTWAANLGYTDPADAIQTALLHAIHGLPLRTAAGEEIPDIPELTDEQFERIKALAAEELKDFVPTGPRTFLFPELNEDEETPTP